MDSRVRTLAVFSLSPLSIIERASFLLGEPTVFGGSSQSHPAFQLHFEVLLIGFSFSSRSSIKGKRVRCQECPLPLITSKVRSLV